MDQNEKVTGFERHVRACNNVKLPGSRIPFLIGEQTVGWVTPDIASVLERMPDVQRADDQVALASPAALPPIARALCERGLCRWRGEAFDVRAAPYETPLTSIDRGAIPIFGIEAVGVHVNGLVARADGLHVWVGRRAKDRLMDPGKLDHVVAGGVPAGLGVAETLVKEAEEEASIPRDVASAAVHVGTITYSMERPEGLRRDRLHCYDLMLRDGFVPEAKDGEVELFELWPLARAAEAVRDTDDFKFNVNLVLIDLFIRRGMIAWPEAFELSRLLRMNGR